MSSSSPLHPSLESDLTSAHLSSAAEPDLPETAPLIVTVMCPVGFTPYATEGLTLDKPLFARVTYRRVRATHRR